MFDILVNRLNMFPLYNTANQFLRLFPDGVRVLLFVLFSLWFSITIAGIFIALVDIIKTLFVFRGTNR